MITSIISIGNSRGVRIPKILLEESELVDDVELKVTRGEIRIVSARKRKVPNDSLLLTEKALAADWSRPEEDEAWKNLK
ncbi:hypothetical protein KKE68_04160 [Patescibacteria group bacterium]|nr:hypothetical protein [Patescibacteria group bacterium]